MLEYVPNLKATEYLITGLTEQAQPCIKTMKEGPHGYVQCQ